MKLLSLAVVVASSLLAGCASNKIPKNSQPHVVNDVVITEPLQVDYQTELNIARYSQVISSVKLEQDKLAQLLYDRGVLYDSLGLRSLAQLDFRRALEQKPAYADAYNFIGIHLTLIGQYSQAFEAFDSALEINPEHSYVHLNRGIALHYYGRHELALQDLETFYVKKVDDPYRAIWLYLAEQPIDPEGAKLRLMYNATQLDTSNWAYQLVDMFLDKIPEQEFIDNMANNLRDRQELANRLCEGYFYLAKKRLLANDVEAAKNYFRLALSTNVFEYVEHKYSRLELDRLYESSKLSYSPLEPKG